MLTNELKAIEGIMTYLVNGTSLNKEVYSLFTDSKRFEMAKINLFNIMAIENLLEAYDTNPSFSLEYFLLNGVIPGLYDKACTVPNIDYKKQGSVKSFYDKLIDDLKRGNYSFDENNNVYIENEEYEAIVPQLWLYRLSNAFKKNTYKEMFLFNKNCENNILDVNGLIDYLRHTKTFLVTLSTADPNISMKDVYEEAKDKTTGYFKDKKEVRVDDIIEIYKGFVPKSCDVVVSKYKLADAFWIIAKAQNLEPSFYNEPIERQKELINMWMMEFINSNDIATRQTQKYILSSKLSDDLSNNKEEDKGAIIVGLFNLYIKMISDLGLEFDEISMSSFRLSNYIGPLLQEKMAKLNELIKLVNRERNLKVDAKSKTMVELEKLNAISLEGDSVKIAGQKKKYEKALLEYRAHEDEEDKQQVSRNQLQALIAEEKSNSLVNIAFDNNKIISLILEATRKGRVYMKQNGASLYIELYNDTLGKNVFKASISLEDLLEFIKNVNLTLDDTTYEKRVS